MAEQLLASMHGLNAENEIGKGWPRTEIAATENEAETTADEIYATLKNGNMKICLEATSEIDVIKEIEPGELKLERDEPFIFMTIWNGEEPCGIFAGTWMELAEAIETARKAKKAREESETASN